jgi:hypothetical protein
MFTMKLSIRVLRLLMLAMSLNSSLVCATLTRLRKRYATGHDAVAIPPRLLKEQGSEGVTTVFKQQNVLPGDTTPQTRNVNGQEPQFSVGMLAALPELRLDQDERASLDENTEIALERHFTPPEERNVDGDSGILPRDGQTRNLFRGRNTEWSLETIEKVRRCNDDC